MSFPLAEFRKFSGYAITGKQFNDILAAGSSSVYPVKLMRSDTAITPAPPYCHYQKDTGVRFVLSTHIVSGEALCPPLSTACNYDVVVDVHVPDEATVSVESNYFRADKVTVDNQREFVTEEWLNTKEGILRAMRGLREVQLLLNAMRDEKLRSEVCDTLLDKDPYFRMIPDNIQSLGMLTEHLSNNGALISTILRVFKPELELKRKLCYRAIKALHGCKLTDIGRDNLDEDIVLCYIACHSAWPTLISHQFKKTKISDLITELKLPAEKIIAALLICCDWFHFNDDLIPCMMLQAEPQRVNSIVCTSIPVERIQWIKKNVPKAHGELKYRLLYTSNQRNGELDHYLIAVPDARTECPNEV